MQDGLQMGPGEIARTVVDGASSTVSGAARAAKNGLDEKKHMG